MHTLIYWNLSSLGSSYRIPISSAILQLQEAGRIHVLKKRWWKERRGGGQCKVSYSSCLSSSISISARAVTLT
jgi:hypothetical protein